METVATQALSQRGILRHSRWDALMITLSAALPCVFWMAPSIPVVAIGIWWNSNTISHNFIHAPFFHSNAWNRVYSLYLTLILGFPQTLWRDRHLAHHRGQEFVFRWTGTVAVEFAVVLMLWGGLLWIVPGFFWFVYLPGYAIGLSLCFIHGYFEHARGTTSHYGPLYNFLFFNDGYHVEHHLRPGEHWTRLPEHVNYATAGAKKSPWPPVLRWVEAINLESLERIALRSRLLQGFLLNTHERALRALSKELPPVRRVVIVGGGMFPRTAILLRRIVPSARIVIVDADAEHMETAKAFLDTSVEFEHRIFDASRPENADLLVIPLSFIGDRAAVYRLPSAPAVLVHDWIWNRHGRSVVVSLVLLKRINLIQKRPRAK